MTVLARNVPGVLGRTARVVFLSLAAIVAVVPLVWLVLAPTKLNGDFTSMPPLAFGSFEKVGIAWNNLMSYNNGEVIQWLLNTIGYSAAGVILSVVVSIPAGYSLAMYQFRGKRAVLLTTLIAMILPAAAIVIPIYRELALIGMANTIWSVILPSAFFPFGVYLTYLHFQTALPRELVEAAKLDGATDVRVFLSLGIPLARPAIALVTFFAFVANWNNYFLPYVMLVNDRLYTLQLGIQTLLSSAPVINSSNQSNLPIHRPEAALAALFAVVPIAIFFLAFQRVIGTGMLAGAVKG